MGKYISKHSVAKTNPVASKSTRKATSWFHRLFQIDLDDIDVSFTQAELEADLFSGRG